MTLYKIIAVGLKNWGIEPLQPGSHLMVYRGEKVREVYEIEAEDMDEAEEEAVRRFNEKGYHLEEIL